MKYSEPVSELFSLDYPEDDDVMDYKSLGITTNHINDLMRMATDADLLNSADDEDDSGFWAAIHAWFALGQLGCTDVIPNILELVEKYDFDLVFDRDFPKVFCLIGHSAIPILRDFINDETKFHDSRSYAIEGLGHVGKSNKSYRDECVAILTDFIAKPSIPDLAGIAVSVLIDFDARESISVIKNAFDQGYVDIDITGDLEDVEVDLGIRKRRSTPRPHYNALPCEVSIPKVGQNDPCPCGSGKEFKKCCLH
jgi:hypothetical protein